MNAKMEISQKFPDIFPLYFRKDCSDKVRTYFEKSNKKSGQIFENFILTYGIVAQVARNDSKIDFSITCECSTYSVAICRAFWDFPALQSGVCLDTRHHSNWNHTKIHNFHTSNPRSTLLIFGTISRLSTHRIPVPPTGILWVEGLETVPKINHVDHRFEVWKLWIFVSFQLERCRVSKHTPCSKVGKSQKTLQIATECGEHSRAKTEVLNGCARKVL